MKTIVNNNNNNTKSMSNTKNTKTRKLVATESTDVYIACATFIKRRGEFRVWKNSETQRLEVINPKTRERIKFTDVARNYDPYAKHIFNKVLKKYDDGTVFECWRIQNQYKFANK